MRVQVKSLATLVAIVLVAVAPGTARGDFYADARNVIQQLIEDNIAHEVIPKAARQIPALCTFFPASINAIAEQRFTGLPAVVRKEFADLAGYEVLARLAPQRTETKDPLVGVAQASVTAAEPAPPANVDCVLADHESTATTVLRSCVARKNSPKEEIACTLALTTRDVIDGDPQLEQAAQRLISAIFALALAQVDTRFAALVNDQADELREAVERAVRGELTSEQLVNELARLSGIIDVTAAHDELRHFSDRLALALDKAEIDRITTEVERLNARLASARTTLSTLRSLVLPVLAATRGAPIDYERALSIIADLVARCPITLDETKPLRDFLDDEVAAIKALREIVRMLQARNYGGAAEKLLAKISTPDCTATPENAACTETGKAALIFVEKLIVYTVDAVTSKTPQSSAAEDFRKAAMELIRIHSFAGVARVNSWPNFYRTPEFSLRKSFRMDVAKVTDTASVELLTLRTRPLIYTQQVYLAFHVSLLDGLGPFTELATRDPAVAGGEHPEYAFLIALVAPRVDLEFGLPGLSRNLVIGGGAAGRFYRVEKRDGVPTYCFTFFTCRGDTNRTWPGSDNLEFSLFVKYVM